MPEVILIIGWCVIGWLPTRMMKYYFDHRFPYFPCGIGYELLAGIQAAGGPIALLAIAICLASFYFYSGEENRVPLGWKW